MDGYTALTHESDQPDDPLRHSLNCEPDLAHPKIVLCRCGIVVKLGVSVTFRQKLKAVNLDEHEKMFRGQIGLNFIIDLSAQKLYYLQHNLRFVFNTF